jgi:alpha-galactosidase
MRDALRATGRPIVYSINPNSFHAITGATYNWGEVADLWRTTEDLLDIWQNGNTNSYPMGVGNVLDVTAPLAAQSGPGHWNDPDIGRPGLSLTESRSHFALWALMGAPLMAGNDIRTLSSDVSAILRNPRLMAVNQEPRCSPNPCPTARSRWACSTGARVPRPSPPRPRKSACPAGPSP